MKNITALILFISLSFAAFSQYPTFRIDYKFIVDEAVLQTNKNQVDESQIDLINTATLAQAFQKDGEPIIRIYVNKNLVQANTSIYSKNYEIIDKNKQIITTVFPDTEEYYTHKDIDNGVIEINDNYYLYSELPIKFINNTIKEIAGYKCKLAKIELMNEETPLIIDIWYNEYFPQAYWGEYKYLKKIPGAALEISTSGIGIQATKISPEGRIDIFRIPSGFTQIDPLKE